MDPGILIADIGDFHQVFVDTAAHQRVHEDPLVGLWGASRHNDSVKAVFCKDLFHLFQRILTARKQVLTRIDDIRERLGILLENIDVYNTGDVDAAVADKNADARLLLRYIDFIGNFHAFGAGVSDLVQKPAGQACRRTRLAHGTRYVFGSLKYPGHEDPGPRGFHRRLRLGNSKVVFVQFDPQTLGQFFGCLRNLKPYGQHHHVERLFLARTGFIHILQLQIASRGHLVDRVNSRINETNPGFFFGS